MITTDIHPSEKYTDSTFVERLKSLGVDPARWGGKAEEAVSAMVSQLDLGLLAFEVWDGKPTLRTNIVQVCAYHARTPIEALVLVDDHRQGDLFAVGGTIGRELAIAEAADYLFSGLFPDLEIERAPSRHLFCTVEPREALEGLPGLYGYLVANQYAYQVPEAKEAFQGEDQQLGPIEGRRYLWAPADLSDPLARAIASGKSIDLGPHPLD